MIVNQNRPTSTDRLQEQYLQIRGVSKEYRGGIKANANISLDVFSGEIVGILGPNGAGKTTLVRQITTEILPTTGDILVAGRSVVTEPNKVKELLGVVPQEVNLFDYLTCHQHLRIFGKLRGLCPNYAKERADHLLDEFGLIDYRNTPVSKLSGGLKRRLLIGIAALATPKLMVVDEPTSGLDPKSRRDVWKLLRQYQEQGTSILITTHYMEEAEALCNRVGIIQHGHLLALDTISNLQAGLGYKYKATYISNEISRERKTVTGATNQQVLDQIKKLNISDFQLSKTNLEDVYFALTGELEGLIELDV